MMVVPCLYFSGASGLGRDQRMKSSLSSTCQAAHNCSGLHPPPLQLREKGTTFSNSLSWPRQYVLRLLLPMRAPSHNSQHHYIGQQQLWWTPSKMVSKYLHLSKKGKASCPSLILSWTHWNMAAVFPQVPSGIYTHLLFGTETKYSQLFMHQA